MKALVIAPQPFFSPRGTPFSVYYRTLVTASQGVEIDLLTYGEGRDVDIPGVRIVRIPRVRFLEPVPVGPSFRKLLLDKLLVLWTLGMLIRNRYDVVHAHEEAVFFSRFLKPLFRFRLVYDMHSALGVLRSWSLRKPGTEGGFYLVVRRALWRVTLRVGPSEPVNTAGGSVAAVRLDGSARRVFRSLRLSKHRKRWSLWLSEDDSRLPVRGQRTSTNARTRKGPARPIAGKKKATK